MSMPTSIFKHWSSHSSVSVQSWQDYLQDATRILDELAANSEGEFIRLGEKLQDFYFRTRKLSDLSSQVAGCLAEDALKQHEEGLRTVFALVQKQHEQSGKGMFVLSSLLKRFDSIGDQLGQFDPIVRNLNVLCNFIKIESARLGRQETGFTALGDEVRNLASNVSEKSNELKTYSGNLAASISYGLGQMTEFENKQRGFARLILDQAVQNLATMTQRHQSSSKALEDIAGRWKRIAQSIGEVVASMQFHDITRQRIEHVRDALLDVKGKTGTVIRMPDEKISIKHWRLFRSHGKDLPVDLSGMSAAIVPCEVQMVQLKDAESDLNSAVGRIILNLRRIATEVTVMTEDLQALTQSGNRKEESFLSDLEKKLSALAEAMDTYGKINRNWRASVEQVTGSLQDMTLFIREIEKIEIHMRMIALNACIHAAHLGQEGAALGTLAESIGRLSDDTSQKVNGISGNLKSIMEEAGSIDMRSANQALGMESDLQESGSGQIGRMIAPLQRMDQEVSELLAGIDREGKTLTHDIDVTLQGITIHEQMAGEIEKVIHDLETVVGNMRLACPSLPVNHGHEGQPGMTGRYTMEREREIHQAVTDAAIALPGTIIPETAGAGEVPAPAMVAPDQPVDVSEAGDAGTSLPGSPDEDSQDTGDNFELF